IEAERQLANRRHALAEAEREAVDWQQEWEEAQSRCWLGVLDPKPDVASMRAILDTLDALQPVLREREQLAAAILRMEQERARFIAETEALRDAMQVQGDADPQALFRSCLSHIEEARTAARQLQESNERLQREEESLKELLAQTSVNDGYARELKDHFG